MNTEVSRFLAETPIGSGWWVALGLGGATAVAFLLLIARFLGLWLQAYMSNADVSLIDLIGMRLRKVEMKTVVLTRIQLVKSGIHEMSVNDLESHYLAGGRVINVTRAIIAANRAALGLDWKTACAIDLAGRDITDAINTSVNPRVIDVPNPDRGRQSIDGVAKDGIQLSAKARVTVRTNIRQLIGGATEETIIARVGEGIVSAIGSSETYKAVLENPNRISKAVLGKGLDSGTAFEILSIDIADIDVGENIGAKLQLNQAEADMRRFQAEAEKRRTMAVALTAEHRAKVEENRAKIVLAEAEVPVAMAGAFRAGNLEMVDSGLAQHKPNRGAG